MTHKEKEKKKKKKDKKSKREAKKSNNDDSDDELANLCKICFEKPIDTVILECGHQIVCELCSGSVGNLCPLCRQPITRIVRSFKS